MLHRLMAMYESGKVELKLVLVAGRIGALDLTELALKTGSHDAIRLGRVDTTDITVVFVV
jgi:hypothetical protein